MSEPPITRRGVVAPVRIDPTGLNGPTRDQARGPNWRRTSHGFYVPSTVDPEPVAQRIVEASSGVRRAGAVTGWAGLHWLGLQWFGGLGPARRPMPVDVVPGTAHANACQPGIRICEQRIAADDVVRIDGLRVSIPEFSAWLAATIAPGLTEAVTVLDMVVSQDTASLAELSDYAESHCRGRKGIQRFREAIGLARENVWSPRETPMRLIWQRETGRAPLGNMPLGNTPLGNTLLCNAPIFDLNGRRLITPDLFDPIAGVAGEYDGLQHLADGQRRRDLNREEIYRQHGIEVATMMTQDSRDRSDFVARLRASYLRASRRSGPRTWTVEQPDWWTDTSTVAARRALRGIDREIWLRRSVS